MSSDSTGSQSDVIHFHPSDKLCYITIVTANGLCTGCVEKSKSNFKEIDPISDNATELLDFLGKKSSFLNPTTFVEFSALESLEWYGDDEELVVKYHDAKKNKTAKTTTKLSDEQSRSEVVEAIKRHCGVEFNETAERASIWRQGQQGPFWGIVLSIIPLWAGINGLLTGETEMKTDFVGRRAGLKRLIAETYNSIGPNGAIIAGGCLLAGSLAWWYINCKTGAEKTIVVPQRNV